MLKIIASFFRFECVFKDKMEVKTKNSMFIIENCEIIILLIKDIFLTCVNTIIITFNGIDLVFVN